MVKDLKEGIADMKSNKPVDIMRVLGDRIRIGNKKEVEKLGQILNLVGNVTFNGKHYENNVEAKELRDIIIQIGNIVAE